MAHLVHTSSEVAKFESRQPVQEVALGIALDPLIREDVPPSPIHILCDEDDGSGRSISHGQSGRNLAEIFFSDVDRLSEVAVKRRPRNVEPTIMNPDPNEMGVALLE